jgi:uncharacterized membrane protein
MWFWIIFATGILVLVSQFLSTLRQMGSVAALLLAVVSVVAVVVTLLAATTGGSFKLDSSEAILVLGFFLIATFGFLLLGVNRNTKP